MTKMIPVQAKVEALFIESDNEGAFNLMAIMPNGNSYIIQKGFKTEEVAKQYRIDFLEAYRKF